MKTIIRAGLLCSAFALGGPALGNDSSAMLGAGGLVLTKSADIRMATEDLFISPNQIKVHYTFVNDSAKDIDTIVAFPLPDVDNYELSESPIGTTIGGGPNFIGFKVAIDGKPVAVTAEERAFLKGKDITDKVRAAGLPLNIVIGGYEKLNKLTRAQAAPFIKAGLIEDISGGSGDPTYHALWTTKTKFFWKQRFPAGKTLTVDHSYQPVTGQTFFGSSSLSDKEQKAWYMTNFCLDPATAAAAQARLDAIKKRTGEEGLLNQFTTQYVVLTANNWKGPIGKFHLTIDKLKPDNVLSLCWAGDLKKTSATRFETTLTNFAPKKDISLLVLESPPPGSGY